MKRVLVAVVAGWLALASPAAAAPGPDNAPEYWFDNWQLERLWSDGVRGQGQVIAEIDTGVNASLSELRGRVLSGTDFGRPGNGQVDREVSEFGHGTAMASIMVARPGLFGITGIAPGAKILPVAVPLNGTVDFAASDRLPDAIRWAADHGATVISMSIGGKRRPASDDVPCPDDEQAAVFHALDKGAVVVAAVGNTGPTANTVEEPGVCLGVVSVGAIDASGRVADFSGRQPYLSLVAPGVSVPSLSRVPGQAYSGDGTSQATAITAATVALVRSRYPHLAPRDVITRLLATLDARRTRPSSAYGYGALNAYRAVTARVPTSAANPVWAGVAPFLAREHAFAATVTTSAPRPVDTSRPARGDYAVGRVPTAAVWVRTGIAAASVGVLALVVLLLAARRRRRARKRWAAAQPVTPLPLPDPTLVAAPVADADRVVDQPPTLFPAYRPRPGPGPAPQALPVPPEVMPGAAPPG